MDKWTDAQLDSEVTTVTTHCYENAIVDVQPLTPHLRLHLMAAMRECGWTFQVETGDEDGLYWVFTKVNEPSTN
jgi:hypothetical protein